MGDKIARLANITNKGINLVEDEKIRDTLIDLHNYSAMAIMLMDQEKSNKYYMDISNEATIIKNKQILDKFSINIHLIKNFIYVLFIGLFITLYVTYFFPLNHHLIRKKCED